MERSIEQLTLYAAAAATSADYYAKKFYPMTRDADEKMICCEYGGEDMGHFLSAAKLLRERGVELDELVERPVAERGLGELEALETASTWTERAVFSVIFERALLAQLEALADVDDAAIAEVASAAIASERKHVEYGMALLSRACAQPEARAQVEQAVARMWPAALAVVDEDEARAGFVSAAREALSSLGLAVELELSLGADSEKGSAGGCASRSSIA